MPYRYGFAAQKENIYYTGYTGGARPYDSNSLNARTVDKINIPLGDKEEFARQFCKLSSMSCTNQKYRDLRRDALEIMKRGYQDPSPPSALESRPTPGNQEQLRVKKELARRIQIKKLLLKK